MLGFGSIGEFSIGEFSVTVTHDVPINVTASNSVQPQTPEIRRGTIIGVPAVSMSASPSLPSVPTGASLTPPTVEDITLSQILTILRGTSIAINTLNLDETPFAPPVLRGGISIFWSSEEQIPNQTGGIGIGSIGEFAIGEGPVSYATVQRIPRPMLSPRVPEVVNGGSVSPGSFDLDDVPYALDLNARARKLRSMGIAS